MRSKRLFNNSFDNLQNNCLQKSFQEKLYIVKKVTLKIKNNKNLEIS